jgi:hypothetical protein
MITAAIAVAADSGSKTNTRDVVEVVDLNPFTDVAYIPLGSSLSSLKFEGLKAVRVATRSIATSNKSYCEQMFQDPGGSAFCPSMKTVAKDPAYKVTYSFYGEPMTSDEYGGTRFTFSVYFRPADLDPTLRQMISEGHFKEVDVERFFVLSTARSSGPEVLLDQANSKFCAGNYVDGNWTRTDSKCEEKLTYRIFTRPSGFVAVKVTPISPPQRQLVGCP